MNYTISFNFFTNIATTVSFFIQSSLQSESANISSGTCFILHKNGSLSPKISVFCTHECQIVLFLRGKKMNCI